MPGGEQKVPDELYAQAAEHYDRKALATLSIAIGQTMFFLAVTLISRPRRGMPPTVKWTQDR